MNSPVDVITGLLADLELDAVLHVREQALWADGLSALEYVPVSHTQEKVEYQLSYLRGDGCDWWDISLILRYQKKPVGVWPLSLSQVGGDFAISTYGIPIIPPLMSNLLPQKTRRTLISRCYDLIFRICDEFGISKWQTAESFYDETLPAHNQWHVRGMQNGAAASLEHELYVNLAQTISEYKSTMRKSYKSLVSASNNPWDINVLSAANPNIWEEFRLLHLETAGRSTRSSESWTLQHEAISKGAAMLVYLRDAEDRFVGGGFFFLSRDEANYAVGVYDRSLFDKPLGHIVQYRAIQEMMARGLKWYKIGSRPYATSLPSPSEKELSIALFKQGFATHLMPRYILLYDQK